jgi:hypothetical protein
VRKIAAIAKAGCVDSPRINAVLRDQNLIQHVPHELNVVDVFGGSAAAASHTVPGGLVPVRVHNYQSPSVGDGIELRVAAARFG